MSTKARSSADQPQIELFFERLGLAGLKAAKDALLREIVCSDGKNKRHE